MIQKSSFFVSLKKFYDNPGWFLLLDIPPFFIGGFCVISFLAASTPSQAILNSNTPIPSGWEAGVFNHGEYYQWITIQQHPFLFGISVIVFVGSWLHSLYYFMIFKNKEFFSK